MAKTKLMPLTCCTDCRNLEFWYERRKPPYWRCGQTGSKARVGKAGFPKGCPLPDGETKQPVTEEVR